MNLRNRTIILTAALVVAPLQAFLSPAPAAADAVVVAPPDSVVEGAVHDLQAALRDAPEGTLFRLMPGIYDLTPEAYVEPTCGNCETESTQVVATVGLRVTGENLHIQGPREGAGAAVIRTHAGYGILFEDCEGCALSNVTVTGGERDTSALATDAAVIAKRSSLRMVGCTIRDNIGDSTTVAKTVVGIIGVAGREGSILNLRGNRIIRNSWDGIALYRGAQADIEANVIDGVDLARGTDVGGGRGVGIGVTWNAYATIRGNLVRRYWKGIGAFVDAQVTVEENIVEHVATWGYTLWDAGTGRPSGVFQRNVAYDTGACGASIVRGSSLPPPPGRFVQNVLIQTGQDPRYDSGEPYCQQVPVAEETVPDNFTVAGNILFANRYPERGARSRDLEQPAFLLRWEPVRLALAERPRLAESDFWKKYGGE
jgi:hypothetical protein